jgi:hypothetical protein
VAHLQDSAVRKDARGNQNLIRPRRANRLRNLGRNGVPGSGGAGVNGSQRASVSDRPGGSGAAVFGAAFTPAAGASPPNATLNSAVYS